MLVWGKFTEDLGIPLALSDCEGLFKGIAFLPEAFSMVDRRVRLALAKEQVHLIIVLLLVPLSCT